LLLGALLAVLVTGAAAANPLGLGIDRTAQDSLVVTDGAVRVGGSVRCDAGNRIEPRIAVSQGQRFGTRQGNSFTCETSGSTPVEGERIPLLRQAARGDPSTDEFVELLAS
jgi:hypothetical protein